MIREIQGHLLWVSQFIGWVDKKDTMSSAQGELVHWMMRKAQCHLLRVSWFVGRDDKRDAMSPAQGKFGLLVGLIREGRY